MPIWTAHDYHEKLEADGVATEFVTHGGGHELNSTMLDASGVKSWFDLYY